MWLAGAVRVLTKRLDLLEKERATEKRFKFNADAVPFIPEGQLVLHDLQGLPAKKFKGMLKKAVPIRDESPGHLRPDFEETVPLASRSACVQKKCTGADVCQRPDHEEADRPEGRLSHSQEEIGLAGVGLRLDPAEAVRPDGRLPRAREEVGLAGVSVLPVRVESVRPDGRPPRAREEIGLTGVGLRPGRAKAVRQDGRLPCVRAEVGLARVSLQPVREESVRPDGCLPRARVDFGPARDGLRLAHEEKSVSQDGCLPCAREEGDDLTKAVRKCLAGASQEARWQMWMVIREICRENWSQVRKKWASTKSLIDVENSLSEYVDEMGGKPPGVARPTKQTVGDMEKLLL